MWVTLAPCPATSHVHGHLPAAGIMHWSPKCSAQALCFCTSCSLLGTPPWLPSLLAAHLVDISHSSSKTSSSPAPGWVDAPQELTLQSGQTSISQFSSLLDYCHVSQRSACCLWEVNRLFQSQYISHIGGSIVTSSGTSSQSQGWLWCLVLHLL